MAIVLRQTADDITQGRPGPYVIVDDGDRSLGHVLGTPVRIVEFTNHHGRPRYGLTVAGQPDQEKYLRPTDFVRDPHIFWERAP